MTSSDTVKGIKEESESLLPEITVMEMKRKEEEDLKPELEAGGYPWPLLLRTILLFNAYLALGVNDAIRGPTLLDLRLNPALKYDPFVGIWLAPPSLRSPSSLSCPPSVP